MQTGDANRTIFRWPPYGLVELGMYCVGNVLLPKIPLYIQYMARYPYIVQCKFQYGLCVTDAEDLRRHIEDLSGVLA